MTPDDVKKYYNSQYNFEKETGMSHSTLGNWLRKGLVPLEAQLKLERLTEGALKADWPFPSSGKNFSNSD
jgi:hypothetical protein